LQFATISKYFAYITTDVYIYLQQFWYSYSPREVFSHVPQTAKLGLYTVD